MKTDSDTTHSPADCVQPFVRPLVFLDFDGVIRCHGWMRDAIGHLNWLVRMSGAGVVVSSDWRHSWEDNELRNQLAKVGVVADVLGATPILPHSGGLIVDLGEMGPTLRSKEIRAWRSGHRHEGNYVVLDDMERMEQFEHAANLVKTQWTTNGLTLSDARKALHILTHAQDSEARANDQIQPANK